MNYETKWSEIIDTDGLPFWVFHYSFVRSPLAAYLACITTGCPKPHCPDCKAKNQVQDPTKFYGHQIYNPTKVEGPFETKEEAMKFFSDLIAERVVK